MKMKDDNYWKDKLSPEKYQILRKQNTEPPFSGEYVNYKEAGKYKCGACGELLFDSNTKYDSKSGWPSFYDAIPGSVEFNEDNSYMMQRTEVICANCKSHLGHIFDDGPQDKTGKRYCINSLALDFKKE